MKQVSGLVFKLWRYVLECRGLWLCDSSDKIRSNKLFMAVMWLWVTKKLLKWENAKNILFHSRAELSLQRLIWYRCSNMCLKTCNTSLFNSLARGLRYFHDVELLYPSDKFQRNWIFDREHTKHKHHFYCVADTIKLMF